MCVKLSLLLLRIYSASTSLLKYCAHTFRKKLFSVRTGSGMTGIDASEFVKACIKVMNSWHLLVSVFIL